MIFQREAHPTEEDLLRFVDGEASPAAVEKVRKHCEACAACRARVSQLETTSSEFADLYRSISRTKIEQSGESAWTNLRARLATSNVAQPAPNRSYVALALAATLLCVIAFYGRSHFNQVSTSSVQAVVRLLPDNSLTPGATRPVDLAEICPAIDDDRDPAVPSSLKTTIFREYGMSDTAAEQYQVDYLINPQLGGTNDIRNLWPEPYRSKVWNARVKDELEDRLHLMVCNRQIDLQSAQREIATDWIAAYKKYFHTSRPS